MTLQQTINLLYRFIYLRYRLSGLQIRLGFHLCYHSCFCTCRQRALLHERQWNIPGKSFPGLWWSGYNELDSHSGVQQRSGSATIVTLPVADSYTNLKFNYYKDSLGYNVGFDDVYVFAGSFSGIAEHSVLDASIYPNPTQGKLMLKWHITVKSLSVTVSNILGKVVKQVVMNTISANYEVDLNDLEDGVYMVNVRNEFGEKTQSCTQEIIFIFMKNAKGAKIHFFAPFVCLGICSPWFIQF